MTLSGAGNAFCAEAVAALHVEPLAALGVSDRVGVAGAVDARRDASPRGAANLAKEAPNFVSRSRR